MRKELMRLIEIDGELGLLGHIGALLSWDQETFMPIGAVDERSEQIALIESIAHDRAVSPEIGDLLAALGSTSASPSGSPSDDSLLDDMERAYLRVARRQYDRDTKLPADLVAELAREASLAQAAWIEARAKNDFPAFAPYLERIVELKKRQAACLTQGGQGARAARYDALLDLFEPGSTEASIAEVFGKLRGDLVALLDRIASKPPADDSFLRRPCPVSRQAAISGWLMDVMGYERGRGRLDTVAHPFTTTLGVDDVRITTRFIEDSFVSSLFSTVHETGHALYELGIAPGPAFKRTKLHDAASMAVHESQSRMWENMIGRSAAFWKGMYPRLVELASGGDARGPLEGIGLDSFLRAINKVEPSPIRTEADEVTYSLHIILRFELESDLISGRLAVNDLPEAWNAKMKELLGLSVPDDARGCLQDVHWSAGLFGYFPSYALGNLYAAQFWSAMKRDMPDLDERIESGDLGSVLGWLRAKIHRHGSSLLPTELVYRVTGSTLDPKHFVAYLDEKYSRIYAL
jgi:carboxypeptidase Taq